MGVTDLPLSRDYLPGPAEALRRQEVELQGCPRCKLSGGRTTIVFGSGNPQAELMCIGEAPGADEDAQGKPFVGRAGQLLTRMLQSIGLDRDRDCYITNIVKCFISPRVLIYTAEGYKAIKDVHVGDLVLTHRGRFRKVVYVRPREVLAKGSTVIRLSVRPIGVKGRPIRMTVTPDHPFLVDGAWTPAGEIKPGDQFKALGDRCEVCGHVHFVRPDRYDKRSHRTCSYRCHNLRIFWSPEAGQKARLAVRAQYAAEYVFVDAVVEAVESRRTRQSFPLYNIGVEEDESYLAAGLVSHNCRPPGNRNPEPDEIAACEPFLLTQIATIQPKVILALGGFAAQTLLRTKEPISRLRGRVLPYHSIVLIPTFHPAFLIRNPGPEYRRLAWADLKLAKQEYDRLRSR